MKENNINVYDEKNNNEKSEDVRLTNNLSNNEKKNQQKNMINLKIGWHHCLKNSNMIKIIY